MCKKCVVIGGGGHAKVVIDALGLMPGWRVVGILDNRLDMAGQSVLGVPVLGGDERFSSLVDEGITHFVIGLAGIGPTPKRTSLFERASTAGLLPLTVRHPAAIISMHALLGEGVQIFAGAVVQADARIGRGSIINTGVIVEHDVEVGDFAHAASGSRLAGGVKIGPGAFIGAGATVLQGVCIGADALVGAGAVVLRDVSAGTRVAGVPACELHRE